MRPAITVFLILYMYYCCRIKIQIFTNRIVMDKEFEIKYETVYTTNNTQIISAVDIDKDNNNRIFYSVDRRIYSWNKSDGDVQLVIEAGAKIQSFHHIGAEKFLIRDTSSTYVVEKSRNKQKNSSTCIVQVPKLSNCISRVINNSQSWGPIAVDYSKPTEVYFETPSVINKVNLEDSMQEKPVWQRIFTDSISAMAFDKDFSALYFMDNEKPTAVSHLDLSTFAFIQVPLHDNVTIDQAVNVFKNTFLCLTEQSALILLDSNSGRYRHLSLRKSPTAMPCNHSECSRELGIKALASHTTKYGHLYVLDTNSRILALDYSHIGKKIVWEQHNTGS